MKFLLLVLLVIIATVSCNCEDMYCVGLDSQYLDWSRSNIGDTQKYINNTGAQIYFVTATKEMTPKSVRCSSGNFGGCQCGGCGPAFVETGAKTNDTSRSGINVQGQRYYATELQTRIEKNYPDSNIISLNYSILYHGNRIIIGPEFRLPNTNDILLSSFTIGATTYNNVVVHETDTTANYMFVWKSYYTKEFGIIAFFDRKTQSMFYRKP